MASASLSATLLTSDRDEVQIYPVSTPAPVEECYERELIKSITASTDDSGYLIRYDDKDAHNVVRLPPQMWTWARR